MENEIKKLLTEKYHIDFNSERFTDEMTCLVDDTIKATIDILNPKKSLENKLANSKDYNPNLGM